MNTEFVFLWLATLLPIVISPGPANILYAASGSSFGVKGTVPFWLATNITSVFQTLAVGFGLNFLISTYPQIADMMKYMGIIFLLYLAFKFFKMSNTLKETLAPLTFK
ncbi:MAG: LysE family translocator, partial [Gammaproteobacteria bacterium]